MGLAGNTIDTRVATIQAITKLLQFKERVTTENLIKISKIAMIYFKEPHRIVHRVVLKLLRKIIGMLDDNSLDEIVEPMVEGICKLP